MKQEERPPLGKMPVVEVEDPLDSSKYVALFHSLVRRQASKLLSGQANELDAELLKYLEKIQNEAYGKGVKTGQRIAMLPDAF